MLCAWAKVSFRRAKASSAEDASNRVCASIENHRPCHSVNSSIEYGCAEAMRLMHLATDAGLYSAPNGLHEMLYLSRDIACVMLSAKQEPKAIPMCWCVMRQGAGVISIAVRKFILNVVFTWAKLRLLNLISVSL